MTRGHFSAGSVRLQHTRGGLSVVNPGFLGDSGTVQRGSSSSSSGRSSVPVPLGAMEEA